MHNDADIIVIGAGLAGMSAAFELSKQGKRVLVLEENNYIGGRTASWIDDGMPVESGLHKFLGIYRALPHLLRECGVHPDDILTWVDALELHTRDGKHAYFGAAPYHHPLRTIRGLLGNNHYISPRDKLRLLLFGIRGIAGCIRHPLKLDAQTVVQAAHASGISEQAIQDVLHTTTSAVLFLPADEFSMYPTFSPVVEGIKRGMTMRVGAFNGGMTDVMMMPIAHAVTKRGGEIRTGVQVRSLISEGGTVSGVETSSGTLRSKAVVLATALHPAQKIIKESFPNHPWFAPMQKLETLSAVTLQCEMDRPAFEHDHTHFSNTAAACFAEQSHTTFRDVPGRLSIIMFPPWELLDSSAEELLDLAEEEAQRMNFTFKKYVTRYRAVRHPHDFYAMKTGTESLRPSQHTIIPGLALAGDYTRQPFSASMEGAVISGKCAAQSLL